MIGCFHRVGGVHISLIYLRGFNKETRMHMAPTHKDSTLHTISRFLSWMNERYPICDNFTLPTLGRLPGWTFFGLSGCVPSSLIMCKDRLLVFWDLISTTLINTLIVLSVWVEKRWKWLTWATLIGEIRNYLVIFLFKQLNLSDS